MMSLDFGNCSENATQDEDYGKCKRILKLYRNSGVKNLPGHAFSAISVDRDHPAR